MTISNNKTTRQGVRDLNYLRGKSNGKRIELPPMQLDCKHMHVDADVYGFSKCLDCGVLWDYNGNEF